MENIEIWKPVPNWENLYEVSNLGRVKSLDRITNYRLPGFSMKQKGKILSLRLGNHGYLEVRLSDKLNGRDKFIRVHRLVALTFIPNPNNLPIINHKNEVKTDNRAENLEWCDSSYNTRYSMKKVPIYQYDLNGVLLRTWEYATDAAKYYDADKSGIQHCAKGDLKTYLNYIWTYTPMDSLEFQKRTTDNSRIKVSKYSLDGELIKSYNSMKEAAADSPYGDTFISMCCSGKRKAKDCIWKKENL